MEEAMASRLFVLGYGIACYLVFLATFLFAVGFVGGFATPSRLDGPAQGPLAVALAVNAALLALFAVQHSVMARPWFKAGWTRIVPPAAERSTYVLLSSLALILLFWQWRPMGGDVWSVTDPVGRGVLYALFAFGWALVLVSTFLINHFDLFGLRQVWLQLLGKPYQPLKFGMPVLYRYVRHPLYVGWFFAFWATPTMSVTHLVFAVATTAYILIAIQLEERDLIDAHPEYENYRRSVPMLIPFTKRRREASQRIASAVQPR
jgi:protein-S-isoprenylcysteine O-methyltransferase Ste14